MFAKFMALAALLLLFSCGEPVPRDGAAKILLLGDSMMASNRMSGQSVADVIEAGLGREVVDRSVPGARYFYALPISGSAGLNLARQYRPGPWDYVVLNGGGNDLLFGCGCGRCNGVLNRLISPDGRSGAIPALVKTMVGDGARVIYTGYLRNPGVQTVIKSCGPAGNELDRRMQRLAALEPDMQYLLLADLVPYRDRSYHQVDLIHPSVKGSRAIAQRILALMAAPKD
ncbi:MAG: SGNH/GDSL hydrolase family protein [Pseudomonadota bacterium]